MQRYVRNRLEYLAFRHVIDTDEMRPNLYDDYPQSAQLLKQGLPTSEITLAELFKGIGYNTAIIGKWHLGYGESNHPSRFGFDTQYGFVEAFSLYDQEDDPDVVNYYHDLFWEEHIWAQERNGPAAITRNGREIPEERYLTDAIVEEAKTFIKASKEQDKPFFAYLPFNAPHTPFQARLQDYDALPQIEDENQRIYLAMIRRLDWAVGELTRYLKDEGLAEDTLIIFSSDNGGAAYTGATDNGPLRAGKFTQFEGGLAVPLMMYWPGSLEQQEIQSPVILTDIFATLTTLAGVALPDDRVYDSINLLDSDVESDASERPLLWRSDYNRAVRYKNWKLLHNKRNGTVRLYDLTQDVGEREDLHEARAGIVCKLMSMLDEWEEDLLDPSWPRVMDYLSASHDEEYWFAI
jgi:arylsulfatase A-like enzyme|tara:strand:+ start:453 stop:1673 length:1221 start_codon:yes stop_codon:yes gene_type:complete